MKKSTIIVAALMMASTSAMASKARMTALGQSAQTGSDYLTDTRGIYTNPATMMDMGDFAAFEAGTTAYSNTNAEGGFTKSAGGMKYGLFLGRQSKLNQKLGASTTYLNANNTFDLMIAGDSGLKWGVGLQYGAGDKKGATPATTEAKNSVMEVNAGVSTDMYSVNVGMNSSSATGDGTSVDNKKTLSDMNAFGSYNLGEGKSVFLSYEAGKLTTHTAADVDAKASTTYVGFANVMKLDAANTFFYSVQYQMGSTDNGSGAANAKTDTTSLPITIGLESEAASWLVLRGSVSQNVLIDTSKNVETDSSAANTTTVGVGAGLKFNKLTLDGTLAAMDGHGATAATGELNGDKLFANASLTYMF